MIFTDVRFVLLFALCWLSFFLGPRSLRAHVLAFWGLVFYTIYATSFVPLVVVLTLACLFAKGRLGTWVVGVAVGILLVYFKWGDTASTLTAERVAQASLAGRLVPLGFSFLAFELLHIVIERRRGRLGPVSAANLFAFVFFFPCRVAGPIKRYPAFTTAVSEAQASFENVYQGLLRVIVGLFKKIVVADLLSLTVAEQAHVESTIRAWSIVLAFSFQIFLDFSAYSDMAIGLSRMLGITVPENFDRPYLASNVRDFWNRWHMSLSFWVRDYIFTPTGHRLFNTRLRNQPIVVAVVSYLITFLAVGLWHGVAPTFVAWGAYHGLLLSAYHVYRAKVPRWWVESPVYQSMPVHYMSIAATFVLVTIGWVPFMTDWTTASTLMRLMLGRSL